MLESGAKCKARELKSHLLKLIRCIQMSDMIRLHETAKPSEYSILNMPHAIIAIQTRQHLKYVDPRVLKYCRN